MREDVSLKDLVMKEEVVPSDVLDVDVFMDGRQLKISTDYFKNNSINEVVLFYWHYYEKKPFYARSISIDNSELVVNVDSTLVQQMQYLGYSSLRLAIAFYIDDNPASFYFRNVEAKSDSVGELTRIVGSLLDYDKRTYYTNWCTGGGVLCLASASEGKFNNEFFRARINECYWEEQLLVVSFSVPRYSGEVLIKAKSLSTGHTIESFHVDVISDEYRTFSREIKASISFPDYAEMIEDAYGFCCYVGNIAFVLSLGDCTQKFEIKALGQEKVYMALPNFEKDDKFSVQIAEKIYPVMLSIVTAVYNTAPFLSEMINSILNQDISEIKKYIIGEQAQSYQKRKFQKVLEFILVDDGSIDESPNIIDDYARISDDIIVIHKENGGVSSARNMGIEASRGKYINFTDSDDILADNFVSESLLFFEEHEEIIMTTAPLKFFDASTGEHWTNYKFSDKNRVIDLLDEPDAITVSTCSSVFRNDEKILFDTNYVNGEDIDYIYGKHYSKNTKLGAIAKTAYMYRRRSIGEGSAIQQSAKNPAVYTDYLKNLAEKLLINSRDENGNIPRYMQHNIMGQLQWKFAVADKGEVAKSVLGEDGFKEYKEKAIDLLKYIDDDIILKQRRIWNEHKYYLLKKKYNKAPELIVDGDDAFFYFGNEKITTSLGNCYVRLDFMSIKDNVFHLEGYGMHFDQDAELIIYINGEKVEYKPFEHDVDKYTMDDICFKANTFVIDYSLQNECDEYTVSMYTKMNGIEIQKKAFRYAKTVPLSQTFDKSYYSSDGWTVRRENKEFVIRKSSSVRFMIDYEREYVNQIEKSPLKNEVSDVLALRKIAYSILAAKKKETKIMLLSDRVNVAGDNGEALFRYINSVKNPNVEAYFVIEESSDDFKKMQEVGNVVARGSAEHLILHLISDFIISSSGEEFVINPWTDERDKSEVIRDMLVKSKFIFLQHGITKDDISNWLNRYNKNITGFVCAAPREAQSILDYNYYYKPENVWLTGFPRHDRLYHNEKNKIVIMPTWRQYLSAATGEENQLVEGFDKSEYCIFYNNLINDKRLLEAADTYGYKICFMPHPGVKRDGLKYFHQNPKVEFLGFDVMYKDVYAEAKLCITDYSSAVMDFALLRKPVVYCHFDKEKFFANHLYTQGYFDYEKDGFGEVTYDMDSLVDTIIDYMKDECKVHQPYMDRMNQFFGFNDNKNCQRVWEKIKQLF